MPCVAFNVTDIVIVLVGIVTVCIAFIIVVVLVLQLLLLLLLFDDVDFDVLLTAHWKQQRESSRKCCVRCENLVCNFCRCTKSDDDKKTSNNYNMWEYL